ncbi:MAG: UDP-N-acetylmuramoyl-L-alanine--D-glutamate ligase [Anaeroplasmataceae bacterium]
MKILLLGHGISNNGIKKILDSYHMNYDYLEESELKKYDYDIVIKSPFIPYTNESIIKMLEEGSIVITDFEFVYWLFNRYIISVTGTNGKTTTVSMLKSLLSDYILCGNIGYPIGEAIIENKGSNLILEASSFELEGCIKFKPDIAIFLPITSAHLDHHKSFDNYFNSKMKNVCNLNENDLVIYPYDDINISNYLINIKALKLSYSLNNKKANIYVDNNYIVYDDFKFNIDDLWSNYNHNILDSMIVVLVGKYLNKSDDLIKNTLISFKGIKYRLERIKSNIYNDSKSTNIYSTIEALKSLNNISLICGGYEKNDELSDLIPYLSKIKKVYIYGMNKNRLEAFFKINKKEVEIFDNLSDATKKCLNDKYDNILFSPMSASYDQYKSYIERGEHFTQIINKYVE